MARKLYETLANKVQAALNCEKTAPVNTVCALSVKL